MVSAHRMPEEMLEYGRSAAGRGLRVLVAGAGGAAHLPGMLASVTSLPVIGVPVPLRHLDGLDSLLSIVQMPAGVPSPRCRWVAPATPACWRRASSAPGRAPRRERLRAAMDEFRTALRDQAHAKGPRCASAAAAEEMGRPAGAAVGPTRPRFVVVAPEPPRAKWHFGVTPKC